MHAINKDFHYTEKQFEIEPLDWIHCHDLPLGMIQKLRNPFLRHFSLGTPPFPLHNFLADQWVVL